MHLLALRLETPLVEESVHGSLITGLARADVGRRLAAVLRLVLRDHRLETDVLSPAFGVWGALFELRPPGLAADRGQLLRAIRGAARELSLQAVETELGAAVALRSRLDAAVSRWEGPADPSALRQRLLDLHAAPLPARPAPASERAAVARALSAGGLSLRLQPIVALPGRATAGFEALGRGPEGGALLAADRLFGAGADCGLRPRLELAFLEAAVALARRVPRPYWLAVNLSPALFESPQLAAAAALPGVPERLVLELSEHLPIESPERFAAATAPLRARGARLAFDDAGCGFLSLDLVRRLRPDIVKLCLTVTRRVTRGPQVLAEVRKTVAAVRAAGAQALAEGVETAEQARLMQDCGCSLAQGFYFSRPLPVAEALAAAAGA